MIFVHQNDLPDGLYAEATSLAIDTETMGLSPIRDRLCVVQICDGSDDVHMVQFTGANNLYDCPNLKKILMKKDLLKIFHFARFDVMMLEKYLKINMSHIYCTKIASKLIRTYTDRHGLRDLAKDLVGIDICKQQQTSDWGTEILSEAQKIYAANDVLHLHKIKDILNKLLSRENRLELAQACFDFLPVRARLDLLGWNDETKDFFAHS